MTLPSPETVLSAPTTSTWLRDALATSLQRDPLDAEREAALLWQMLHRRALEAVGSAPGQPTLLQRVADAVRSTGHVTNTDKWAVAEAVIQALDAAAALGTPDGVLGELVEAGEDDEGCPRLVIATTRDAIRAQAPNLIFRRVRVSLAGDSNRAGATRNG